VEETVRERSPMMVAIWMMVLAAAGVR